MHRFKSLDGIEVKKTKTMKQNDFDENAIREESSNQKSTSAFKTDTYTS